MLSNFFENVQENKNFSTKICTNEIYIPYQIVCGNSLTKVILLLIDNFSIEIAVKLVIFGGKIVFMHIQLKVICFLFQKEEKLF